MRPNPLGAQTFRVDVATNMTLHDLGKGLICPELDRCHILPSLVFPLASKMGKHASNELRERLVDMVYDKSFDLKVAAAALGLNYKTAHKICQVFQKQDRTQRIKPKGRPKVFSEAMREEIVKYCTVTNPDATLLECRKHIDSMKDHFNSQAPSLATIHTILRGLKISLKALTRVPEQRNSEATIELRKKYAVRYTRQEGSVNFVFIDEFGCNLWLRRGRGRSRIGTPATITTPGSRGNNLSVCAAIDINGPIHYFAKYHAFNQEDFIGFLSALSEKLNTSIKNVLIFDNVAFHKTSRVQAFLRENNLQFMFLPPWSPMLNPIEECFSKVKNCIASQRSCSNSALLAAVSTAFASVTKDDCSGWFRHAKEFFPQCLNEQPIQSHPEPLLDDYQDSDCDSSTDEIVMHFE